jgi:crotonobetainyl-CoA:carnitine CoA-transferase CaiB-like acyl-CoA transferase
VKKPVDNGGMTAASSLLKAAPLTGVRVLTLALNLPGPAAVMRLQAMGAKCTKIEPLPPAGGHTSDPMGLYKPEAYTVLHQGVKVVQADLKTEKGQAALHKQLAQTDVLITSFRPSALKKLGLQWADLHLPRLVHAQHRGITRRAR